MMVDKLLKFFGAGAVGGLLNSLVVWIFGVLGITSALGVAISPQLTPTWLYPRIVWGGIWGILLFLPWAKGNLWLRAFILSLGPTFVQLLIVFPFKAGKAFGGIDLGLATPMFVVFFNLVWGVTAVQIAKNAE